jgi:hypothetical protein
MAEARLLAAAARWLTAVVARVMMSPADLRTRLEEAPRRCFRKKKKGYGSPARGSFGRFAPAFHSAMDGP